MPKTEMPNALMSAKIDEEVVAEIVWNDDRGLYEVINHLTESSLYNRGGDRLIQDWNFTLHFIERKMGKKPVIQ